MDWLLLIESCLLLLWVMATTWLVLDNRSKLIALETLTSTYMSDPNQTTLDQWLEEEIMSAIPTQCSDCGTWVRIGKCNCQG